MVSNEKRVATWAASILTLLFSLACQTAYTQSKGILSGRVKNKLNFPVEAAVVRIPKINKQVTTDAKGEFKIELPAGDYQLIVTHLNFQPETLPTVRIKPGATERIAIPLTDKELSLNTIDITDTAKRTDKPNIENAFKQTIPIDARKIVEMPAPKMDIESKLLITMAGIASNNEFSSQYRVRGGNFDENLIYVNDILIYRPQLGRSGQQEGLGFANPNLTQEVYFSTGGFEARYADKLSSVLDVVYRKPREFKGTAEIGILTANLHLEGTFGGKAAIENSEKGKLTYLMGFRRFSFDYLLKGLDTKGDYKPEFYDLQALLNWTPKPRNETIKYRTRSNGQIDTLFLPTQPWEFSLLFTGAYNRYEFFPQTKVTNFGLYNYVLSLLVAFEGKELSRYRTGQAAFTALHRPSIKTNIKYIFSIFNCEEAELFDVEGGYRLGELNTDAGSDRYGQIVSLRGIGTEIRSARNYLNSTVWSAEQLGTWLHGNIGAAGKPKQELAWGLRIQQELQADELKEWNGVDSADYFTLVESFRARHSLNSFRTMAFLQNAWRLSIAWRAVAGIRLNYSTLNQQLLISPRFQLIYDPSLQYPGNPRKNWQLRLAIGSYQQPSFYREMRNFNGELFINRPAQSSVHFIAGGDWQFYVLGRPFKLFTEAYYKLLTEIAPYEITNVRIRYYADRRAEGYAYGLDARINGEFIRGVDSWLSVSYLKTAEQVRPLPEEPPLPESVDRRVRRPSDQRVTVSFYFQDELPIDPTFKVHLSLIYGSGLPQGPPMNIYRRDVFSLGSYQRVDFGLSKLISFRTKAERKGIWHFESLWLALEVFNLFGRQNTVSLSWVRDIYRLQIGVPNYLSQRLLNVRAVARF